MYLVKDEVDRADEVELNDEPPRSAFCTKCWETRLRAVALRGAGGDVP